MNPVEQEPKPQPVKTNLLRELTWEELGIDPIQQNVEPTGFKIGGINDTELVKNLPSINRIEIDKLNRSLLPGEMSGAGFLGHGEKLTDILARDNDVVNACGLTHQELALPLIYIEKLHQLRKLDQDNWAEQDLEDGINEIEISGHAYRIGIDSWMGYQDSPFRDGTRTDSDMLVQNIENEEKLKASFLIGELIGRYGFYEGLGTNYRVAPETIIKTFSHLSEKAANIDSVVAKTDEVYGFDEQYIKTLRDNNRKARSLNSA